MAWTTIETPNAKYILLFSGPRRKIEKVPELFDAVVLESASLGPLFAVHHPQYEDVVKQAIEQNKQVWFTDAKPTESIERKTINRFAGVTAILSAPVVAFYLKKALEKNIDRRALIKGAVITAGVLSPLLAYVASVSARAHSKKIKYHSAWEAATKMQEQIILDIRARNLITAVKCESFLAPRLGQELGRKPTIAMVWHLGHYVVRELLLHPEKRERMLQRYDLGKFVKEGYLQSFKVQLRPDGTTKLIETFPETLKIKKPRTQPAKSEMLTRRKFLATMLRRRRV